MPGFSVLYHLPELEVNPALKLRLIVYEFNCTYIYPWWVKVLLLACNLKLSWQKCVCFCILPLLFQPCFLVYKEKKCGLPWWSSGWRTPLQFHSLVQEDPTYCNQVCGHNYWVCALEDPWSTTEETTEVRSQRTAMKSSRSSSQLEKAMCSSEDLAQP